ncbi:transmembrane protein 138-like [Homalodisca vitripennis]|uniref:transmembrane protein 138-like n=1 Tax=Homalodisca vitripennis TaxID=197043 RepID=UPI001EEC794F|nr:transmembrane protein 138-like [Homalodisca vitripennis]
MLVTQIKYSVVLFFQLSLLVADLVINAFGDKIRYNSGLLLLLYIIQDSLQVLSLTVLFISIFQTNVFQAGFVELLYARFRGAVITAMVYLLLTICLQTWALSERWDMPLAYNWPTFMGVLYTLQRAASCLHYYCYKRSVLCLTDPRFYDDNWITQQISESR